MAYELPDLPYDYGALEPHIDAQTMEIHHDRHHGTYVTNLNNALKDQAGLADMDIEELMRNLDRVPEAARTAVRNNGGGHANHTMFWQIMGPNGGGQPTGPVADAINQAFGGYDQFKEQLTQAGTTRFGSGWAWLVAEPGGGLRIMSTPNHTTTEGGRRIMRRPSSSLVSPGHFRAPQPTAYRLPPTAYRVHAHGPI